MHRLVESGDRFCFLQQSSAAFFGAGKNDIAFLFFIKYRCHAHDIAVVSALNRPEFKTAVKAAHLAVFNLHMDPSVSEVKSPAAGDGCAERG